MNADHPQARALVRAAFAGVAAPSAVALAACIVAVLAFELENAWTLPASLIVAVVCSGVALRNLYALQRRLNGLR